VLAERSQDGTQLIFTAFDPVNGRGSELARIGIKANLNYAWDLSPDGTQIAFHRSQEQQIHILDLAGGGPREITPKGWTSLETLNWSADGMGFFAASRTQESSVLLYIDLQ
jgi:Tol biopolymer transport system component